MKNYWFTADPHLGHKRAIELFRPQFTSVEEMDQLIISNWNSQVNDDDEVYILGDFSFKPEQYMNLLKGVKHLIIGNHDPMDVIHSFGLPNGYRYVLPFKTIHDCLMLKLEKNKDIWLSHYPHRIWPKMHHGARHLFGHVHGEIVQPIKGSMDVGMDPLNFKLINYDEIISRLAAPNLDDLHEENNRRF